MDTRKAWIEKLMSEAVDSDNGRARLSSIEKDAKRLSLCAAELAMSLHKFSANRSVDCSKFSCESKYEETAYSAVAMATTLVNQVRELITSEYLLALKESKKGNE